MSFGSPLDAKEQVRQAIDIVDLVGKYVQLRRQGRIYVGLCPWHDDTRPSLQVNPERQSFKCWVCDIGGDVFSFVMKMEGVEFREALAMLADQAGIELKPYRRREGESGGPGDAGETPGRVEKRTLYQAMAWAEEKYHECLLNWPEGEPARRYLQQRGITDDSIRKFHLGFSPNRGDWILRLAQDAKADTKVLETIGILTRPADGGSPYDRFRGRLLFSIRDPQDRPVGLGGRVLPDSGLTSPAKYINSPETPLFSKSNLLYGLDVAREAIRKSRRALVMEGYTDCVIAHQYGFQDSVAVLGTALGDRHVQTLRRFADRIVLVLDADEAGQRRANEVLELFVAQQVDLQIVTLPEGMDPADFLGEYGAEAFDDLLATRAVDALEHAFRAKTQGVDLDNDVHAASQALEQLISIIARAPRLRADTTTADRLREEKLLERLAFKFRVPEQDVRNRLTALRRRTARQVPAGRPQEPATQQTPTAAPAGKIDPSEWELLEILIRHPECLDVARAEVAPSQLRCQPCREIYEACCRLSDSGTEPTFDRLMLELDDPGIKNFLVELVEKWADKPMPDPNNLMSKVLDSLRRIQQDREASAHKAAFQQKASQGDSGTDLFLRILQQRRNRHGISGPMEG